MKEMLLATYERKPTLWTNARTDKKTVHFVEMRCTATDFDEPSEIEKKYGFQPAAYYVEGVRVHKMFRVDCKGVNGVWTNVGMFYDDKESANQTVKEILNHPWYKGWKRTK